MKYRALVTFSGKVSMVIGEVKDLSNLDPLIIEDLLKAGYIMPVEGKEKPKNTKKGGKK